MSSLDLTIVGAGALARELVSWMSKDGRPSYNLRIADRTNIGGDFMGGRWKCVDPANTSEQASVIVAIADPAIRRREREALQGCKFPSYVHESVLLAHGSSHGTGCIFFPFSLVSDATDLGRGVVVNSHCAIGHDVTVGDYVTLSSFVNLCGRVEVGDGTFFGAGAVVLPGVRIGAGAKIGAGAVVVRDVADGEVVFGVPGRAVR